MEPGRPSSIAKALALYLALVEKWREDQERFWKIEELLLAAQGILRSRHMVLDDPFLSPREGRRLLRDLSASFGAIQAKRGPRGGYRLSRKDCPFPLYAKEELLALNLLTIRNEDGTELQRKISPAFMSTPVKDAPSMDVDTLYGILGFLEAFEEGRKVLLRPGKDEEARIEGDPVSLRYFKGDWYVLVRTDRDGKVHRYAPACLVQDERSNKMADHVAEPSRERWEEEKSFGIRREGREPFLAAFLADPKDRRLIEKLLDGKAKPLGLEGDSERWEVKAYDIGELASWLLHVERGVKVLKPKDLRNALLRKARLSSEAILRKNVEEGG